MSETVNPPWLNLHLTKEAMDHLWDSINNSHYGDARKSLAGHISKSQWIQDKDNWFYENVLKRCSENLYFKDWNNYYNIHVVKSVPPPIFKLDEFWVNYQKQHEFNPPHKHSGTYSFVVFMKIPTHWKEQHALPWLKHAVGSRASNFMFQIGFESGRVEDFSFHLSPKDEGEMFFFPAWLSHQVFPFYECEEERITLSGNIILEANED